MFDFDDLVDEDEPPATSDKASIPAALGTPSPTASTSAPTIKSPSAPAALTEKKENLRRQAESLKMEIDRIRATDGRLKSAGIAHPQGLMPWSRHRDGPMVDAFRAYECEDSNYKGSRTSTIIKYCERNRNESGNIYKFESPGGEASWLTVLIEICVETFPEFDRLWRRRHNGHIEGDYVRMERYMERQVYPFCYEQEDVFLCTDQDFSRTGGTKIACFRGMASTVTDEGGIGAKYELLGDEQKGSYDSMHGLGIKHHGNEALREIAPTLGLSAMYPKTGQPFRPTKSWSGIFKVDWTTSDIYNTLFHPAIGDVLAKAHHQCQWKSVAGRDIVSLYLKMFTRVEPRSDLEVYIYIDEESLTELFIFKNFAEKTHAWGGVAMFDPEVYEMTQEAINCVRKTCPALINWSKSNASKPITQFASLLDMSKCKAY
eukprot:TRINITY_DN24503_c0_g1_i1.p1 TRINITY_DN24503_c0_g1~~TRINITY_DN24503_c0_g1_i1.p1  ORF type:complete len:431 (-),score=65.01 TRINITY_DN24503_c0_g1_i1:117-1409(-)